MNPKPDKHQSIFRADFHVYCEPRIYLITMTEAEGAPRLCDITGDASSPIVNLTSEGRKVEEAILAMPEFTPALSVEHFVVMPDHVHIILWVHDRLSRPLGAIIRGFKSGLTARVGLSLFTPGFNDTILSGKGQLDAMSAYVADNPRCLLLKRAHPGRFEHRRIVFQGKESIAYGNLRLLDVDDCRPVIVHRGYTSAQRQRLEREWLECSRRGGVLVSPFISKDEKAIMENATGAVIVLGITPMPQRFKPPKAQFEMCAKGRLLLVTPVVFESRGGITRDVALALNRIAEGYCAERAKNGAQPNQN